MTDIDGGTTVVGIVGDPVAQSLSPRMHNAAFDALGMNWRYMAFRVPARTLAQALRGLAALGLAGVNVTVPHKEAAAGLVDELDPIARRIGAVNTIRVAGGRLLGFNTDAAGVSAALDGAVAGRCCLIVGAGGGARAAAFALAETASRIVVLNRTESRARGLAEAVAAAAPSCRVAAGPLTREAVERALVDADVVVQATSATMPVLSEVEGSAAMGGGGPFDMAQGRGRAEWLGALVARLRRGMVVLDMVYTPPWTGLLASARAAGAVAVSGLAMLVFQGGRSFELWTGRPAPLDVMRGAVGLDELPVER